CSFLSHHHDPIGYPDLFTQITNSSLHRVVTVHGLISMSLTVHHRKFKNLGDSYRQTHETVSDLGFFVCMSRTSRSHRVLNKVAFKSLVNF
ncbi:hypothetical protein DVH24_009750, partial [Malus domestica]